MERETYGELTSDPDDVTSADAVETPRSSQAVDGAGVLLHCFVGAVQADSAWLISSHGEHRLRVVANWDPGAFGGPQQWLESTFLTRLSTTSEAILEGGGEASGNGASQNGASENGGPATVRHALGAPVRIPGASDGALCAGFADRPGLEPAQLLWNADSFAALAGLYLSDSGGLAAAVGGALRDSLTGCLDFGGLTNLLEGEIDRSARRHHRLSLCFLDLDGFREINESEGHLAGNRVLAAVGGALTDGIRAYDAVGRFGGDEFVVVLPETGGPAAVKLAERLAERIRAASAACTTTPIACSIGVSEWANGMDSSDLLELADLSLRRAKHEGGSRVILGSSPTGDAGAASAFDHATELLEILQANRRFDRPPT